MSFSVRNEASGLEYNGTSINTLFAQRRNLLRPSFTDCGARSCASMPTPRCCSSQVPRL